MQWMPLSAPLNAEVFIRFLGQLIKGRKRKIILIVDNLRVPPQPPGQGMVGKERRGASNWSTCPPIAPELNPDEYLNNHLKQTVTREGIPNNKDDLDDQVWLSMIELKCDHSPHCIFLPSSGCHLCRCLMPTVFHGGVIILR